MLAYYFQLALNTLVALFEANLLRNNGKIPFESATLSDHALSLLGLALLMSALYCIQQRIRP